MNINNDTIAKLRKVCKLSQEEVGLLCGVGGDYIAKIERGDRRLTESIKRKVIEEFELTPAKLDALLVEYERMAAEKDRAQVLRRRIRRFSAST